MSVKKFNIAICVGIISVLVMWLILSKVSEPLDGLLGVMDLLISVFILSMVIRYNSK